MSELSVPDAPLPEPAAQLRAACAGTLTGKGRWRPSFTDEPAFDLKAEAEESIGAARNTYLMMVAGITRSHSSPEERQMLCEAAIEAAQQDFERALSFLEQAEEAGAKLPDIDELAAERQRFDVEVRELRVQLLEFKSLFDALVRSAHEDGMRIRILLDAIALRG